jgi:hypothetical protein
MVRVLSLPHLDNAIEAPPGGLLAQPDHAEAPSPALESGLGNSKERYRPA